MKYIRKGGRPRPYAEWCATVAGTDKEDYREMPVTPKQALLNALIQEQGALCAYTMRRIEQGSSHVEHIKPQTLCRAERRGADLSFANLVACFPREGMNKGCRWGAQHKDNWWENDGAAFVSPLHPGCEGHFHFDLDGNVGATARNDGAAVATIDVLALDHRILIEDRRRAIEEFIYGPRLDSPLSREQVTRAQAAICNRDGQGWFPEYCVAIRQALPQYLEFLRKLAKRRKAARGRR